MKSFIVPALAALLLAGTPAQAHDAHQDALRVAASSQGSDRSGHDGATDGKGHGNKNRSGRSTPQAGAAGGASPGGATSMRGGATAGPTVIGGRGPSAMGSRDRHSGSTATVGSGQTGVTVFRTRPSNWNRYPRRFDTNVYQRNYTAPRHYHWRSYNRPSGWYYQRWVFGQIFPRMFWAQDYWLSDYWMFDLPIPPYGYVWVRYGDDALLVNRRTGRILQVIYDVFD